MRQTPRRARIILYWLTAYIIAMVIVGVVFGADVTWRTVVFTAAFVFFVGSCQLVIERDRERRAEFDRYRARAMARDALRGHEFDAPGKRETPPV